MKRAYERYRPRRAGSTPNALPSLVPSESSLTLSIPDRTGFSPKNRVSVHLRASGDLIVHPLDDCLLTYIHTNNRGN